MAQVLELYTYQTKMWDPMVEDTDREVSDEEAAQTSITYARIPLTEDDQEISQEEKRCPPGRRGGGPGSDPGFRGSFHRGVQ